MDHLSSAGRQPEFVRVTPAEVAKYGGNTAIVLAHIMFRSADGWWRVSLTNLGREVGMSQKVIRKALEALADVVVARHFPPWEDQTLAYRLQASDQPVAPQGRVSQASDQPVAPQGIAPCPTGHGTVPQRASVLLIENVEKGGEEKPGPPACSRHPNGPDHDEACLACMRWRKWLEARQVTDEEEHRRKRREARAIQDNCKVCGGTGWERPDQRCECTTALRSLRR
jgi:hypothetical protein